MNIPKYCVRNNILKSTIKKAGVFEQAQNLYYVLNIDM